MPRKLPLIHPGEILLEEFMKPMGISQNKLARDIDVPPKRVNAIVNRKSGTTADTALRLSKYFGTTAQFGVNLRVVVAEPRTSDEEAQRYVNEVVSRETFGEQTIEREAEREAREVSSSCPWCGFRALLLGLFFFAMALFLFPISARADCRTIVTNLAMGMRYGPEERFELGVCFETGRGGVPQDYAEATKHYRAAAEGGIEDAHLALAIMLQDGRGMPRDCPAAQAVYRKFAERGDPRGMLLLGLSMYRGTIADKYIRPYVRPREGAQGMYGKPRPAEGKPCAPGTLIETHMWLNLALASYSFELNESVHREATSARSSISRLLTPEQLAEAQRRAREWKPKR